MTGRERVLSDHQLPAEELGAAVALTDVGYDVAALTASVDGPLKVR